MDAQVIQVASWKKHQTIYPVAVYNAWVDFGNALTKAWFDAVFHNVR